ncbi:P2X purinoceptor,putative [Ixodes scapularis]|uniref:P2X purinoceptor,putative n=1 Tax=Ixodes scapularis TaxID=6945 RepID=B7PU35_IXOSC|nr:P2X purinoceptor,putative [Ixodes scapularis]|eukprot:XP_002405371.1 P2X purinoceptor,putative [Ixodes scapularis]
MLVQGRAGKASPIPIAINMGSGLGLMVVAMVVCDLVVVHCLKRRKLYKAKKYKFVCSDEYYEVSRLKEVRASVSVGYVWAG